MASGPETSREVAVELMTAMARLRARLRTESAPDEMPWTWSQLTTLARIVADGPTTTSELAQAEHVRRQSMAETLAALRADGLITSAPDPDDGRRTLITATEKGRALRSSIPAARRAWLDTVLREQLTPAELRTLRAAAALLDRIADSDVPTPAR